MSQQQQGQRMEILSRLTGYREDYRLLFAFYRLGFVLMPFLGEVGLPMEVFQTGPQICALQKSQKRLLDYWLNLISSDKRGLCTTDDFSVRFSTSLESRKKVFNCFLLSFGSFAIFVSPRLSFVVWQRHFGGPRERPVDQFYQFICTILNVFFCYILNWSNSNQL